MNRFSRRKPVAAMLHAPLAMLAWPLVSTTAAARQAEAPDPSEVGLRSPTEYESPQYGYTVEWSADWAVDPARVDPVLWFKQGMDRFENIPVYSDTDLRHDRLDIWSADLDARFRVTTRPFDMGIGAHVPSMSAPSKAMGGRAETMIEIMETRPDQNLVVHRHAMNDGTTIISYN